MACSSFRSYGVLDERQATADDHVRRARRGRVDRWRAFVEVPGAISQGRTREEARENVIDALRLMLAGDDGDASVGRLAAASRSS